MHTVICIPLYATGLSHIAEMMMKKRMIMTTTMTIYHGVFGFCCYLWWSWFLLVLLLKSSASLLMVVLLLLLLTRFQVGTILLPRPATRHEVCGWWRFGDVTRTGIARNRRFQFRHWPDTKERHQYSVSSNICLFLAVLCICSCLSVSACLPVSLPACLSACLPVSLFVCLSACLPVSTCVVLNMNGLSIRIGFRTYKPTLTLNLTFPHLQPDTTRLTLTLTLTHTNPHLSSPTTRHSHTYPNLSSPATRHLY